MNFIAKKLNIFKLFSGEGDYKPIQYSFSASYSHKLEFIKSDEDQLDGLFDTINKEFENRCEVR